MAIINRQRGLKIIWCQRNSEWFVSSNKWEELMIKHVYKVKKSLVPLLIVLASCNYLEAQVSVAGSVCIIPGLTYQYIFNYNQSSSPVLGVCITGGILSAGGTCTPSGTSPNSVFVVWKDTSYHRLELTSASGNISLTVQGTSDIR